MEVKGMWNSAAKWGFILGVVMSCSRIFEQSVMLSGEVSKFALLAIEWIFAAILMGAIITKAIKERAAALGSGVVMRLNQGVNFAILVSIFASIISAGAYYVYVTSQVGGFEVYAHQLVESLTKVISEVEISSDMRSIYLDYFRQIEGSEFSQITMFNIVINTMSNYIIVGAVYGLVISFFVVRKLKRAASSNNNKTNTLNNNE